MVHVLGVLLPDLQYARVRVGRVTFLLLRDISTASVNDVLRRRKQDCTQTLCTTTNSRPSENTGPHTDSGHRTCLLPRFPFYRTPTPSHAARLPQVQTSPCFCANRGHTAKSFGRLGSWSSRSAEGLEDRVRGEASREGEHCSPEDDRKLCGQETCDGSACQRTKYPIKC